MRAAELQEAAHTVDVHAHAQIEIRFGARAHHRCEMKHGVDLRRARAREQLTIEDVAYHILRAGMFDAVRRKHLIK